MKIQEKTDSCDIERREAQLWFMALLIIGLLSIALFVVDMAHTPDAWWFTSTFHLALNTMAMRIVLILATLLICAYFRDSVRQLRRKNTELLDDLASHGEMLEKKNIELSRMKELSDNLIGTTDLQTALTMVLDIAVEAIGADIASIMLREKNEDDLKIMASHGLPSKVIENTRLHIGEAIAGFVAEHGQGLIINSDELTGEIAKRALRKTSIVSSVVVPIQINDEIRGVVSIAKKRGGSCFTQDDLGVVSTLANQTSLVVQKLELLEDLRLQIEKLSMTIEELQEAQAQLVQSEKLASIGQLAGGIAHEINNPLQAILGRTEMLMQQNMDEAQTGQLECIHENINRIRDIVANLLSFSHQNHEGEFRDVDINYILHKTLALLEPQMAIDKIQVTRKFTETIPSVSGSAGQLQQVFTNIVLNSYHAIKGQPEGKLIVTSRCDSEGVLIEFADSGPGIETENLTKIFEPFFTTKPEGEGTGLGLSISYGIVKFHGGNIKATNCPDGGACFTIWLPEAGTQKADLENAA